MRHVLKIVALLSVGWTLGAACGPSYETECEAECTPADDPGGSCVQEDKDECLRACAELTTGRSDVCAACLFDATNDMAVNPTSGRCLQPDWADPADTLCDDECGA